MLKDLPEGQLPILDPLPLKEIADQTSPVAAKQFAETYRRMLPQRVGRIVEALNRRDAKEAMDAALSLRISSSMNGALVMERNCGHLVNALKAASYHASREAGRQIQDHLPLLDAVLHDRFARQDAAA